jgi:hypothetical protein
MFVNPLTAQGFVETALREGHKAIIHTAAASNLGQMLQRLCLADDIALVNIVRSPEQADILREIGATHVLNSKDEDFAERLVEAIAETGATVAFDAIGGGMLVGTIIQAMERAAVRSMSEYSRYGSTTFKQLYIYGALDTSPTTFRRGALGFHWSISGWLLSLFLMKAGEEVSRRLHRRVVDELTTTFSSKYTRVIGLSEALNPDVMRAYKPKNNRREVCYEARSGREVAEAGTALAVVERPDLWLAYQRIQWRPFEKAMTRGRYVASFIGQLTITITDPVFRSYLTVYRHLMFDYKRSDC